jgi:hypothetical protein
MGYSRHDDAIYTARLADHKARGTDPFVHTARVAHGTAPKAAHDLLDPKKANKVGKIIRESLDSDLSPNSRAVAVFFDVTGSMLTVPRTFALKLATLMAALVKKNFIPDPHILFGAVGDAYSDRVPLQIGQFEAGNEMDDALTNIFLEGSGGAQDMESYDLALYFIARHTTIDCWEKRGQKGYLFILGDERLYPVVKASQVNDIIGDGLQDDIPVEQIIEEVKKKWNVFWIMPGGTNHWGDHAVIDPMRKLWGQNFLLLENPDDVCELIISTIGVTEGYDLHDVGKALKDVGADADAIGRTGSALVSYAKSASVTRAAVATGSLVEAGKDDVSRL